MNKENRLIATTKKQAITLPTFLLIISLFITIGGGVANNSLQYTQGSLGTYNYVIIPLFALVFYAIGIITKDR